MALSWATKSTFDKNGNRKVSREKRFDKAFHDFVNSQYKELTIPEITEQLQEARALLLRATPPARIKVRPFGVRDELERAKRLMANRSMSYFTVYLNKYI